MITHLKVVVRVASALTLTMAAAAPAMAQNVTTYHNNINRHGEYVVPKLTLANAATMHLDTNFNGTFSGDVYAQPLYWKPQGASAGTVIVATETNQVKALNANTGTAVWTNQLPAAPSSSALQCGNIPIEGITGTPAIDPATGNLYFDAVTGTSSSSVRHMIYALSANTGAVLPGWPIDVQATLGAQGVAFDSTVQGERGAVLVLHGQVYVSFGGRSGDCGNYHGMVVQVTPSGSAPSISGVWSTRAVRGGIWAQGGSASDGDSIYVTTGNTSGASTWSDGEGIIKLASGLAHSTSTQNFYTPTNWQTLDAEDLDLGGTEALPLRVPTANGAPRVIAFGKDGNAYLVNRSNLGGIGGQLAITKVSNSEIITAAALYNTASDAMVVFRNASDLKCSGGSVTMLSVSAATSNPISEVWCQPLNGAGAPIVTTTDGSSNPIVWIIGAEGDNLLHGFNAMTGAVVFAGNSQAMQGLRHFETVLAANNHIYVAGNGQVYGFTTNN